MHLGLENWLRQCRKGERWSCVCFENWPGQCIHADSSAWSLVGLLNSFTSCIWIQGSSLQQDLEKKYKEEQELLSSLSLHLLYNLLFDCP